LILWKQSGWLLPYRTGPCSVNCQPNSVGSSIFRTTLTNSSYRNLTTTVQRKSLSHPVVEFPSVSQVAVQFPSVPQVSLQFPLRASNFLAVSAVCRKLPCSYLVCRKFLCSFHCVPQVALQFPLCARHSPFPHVQLGLAKIL